jgi:hypothetical protein
MNRNIFCQLIDKNKSLLEIGPYANPQFKKPDYQVYYADVCTVEQIKANCSQYGYNPELAPDHIDIPIDLNKTPSYQTDMRFEQIFSSHVIEHQPDLILHLQEVSSLVFNKQTQYFLAIPDKRYCFDHFQNESTIAEVIGAHLEKRRKLLPSSLLQTEIFRAHWNTHDHWNGNHGNVSISIEKIKEFIGMAKKLETEFIDNHAWYFTPESFQTIIDLTYQLELQPWQIKNIWQTEYSSNEFYAILH